MKANNWQNIEERLKQKTITNDLGCWLFTGNIDHHGYGRIGLMNHVVKVHRISACLYLNYDINETKFEVLHKCPNKHCWNPEHLSVGSHQENMWDKESRPNQNTFKTHCKYGHEFTEENTYHTKRGKRLCKTCISLRNKADYDKRGF